jgi:ABC-type Co2+ transport system permease subunit
MPNPDRLMAFLQKLGFVALAFVVINDLILELCKHLTFTGLVVGMIGLLFMSPIAYFVLQSGRPPSEHRPRRGAERTPLLPPNEEH